MSHKNKIEADIEENLCTIFFYHETCNVRQFLQQYYGFFDFCMILLRRLENVNLTSSQIRHQKLQFFSSFFRCTIFIYFDKHSPVLMALFDQQSAAVKNLKFESSRNRNSNTLTFLSSFSVVCKIVRVINFFRVFQ